MMHINFNLRKSNSKKETPINIVIRWDGQRLVYSSEKRVNPKDWNLDPKECSASIKLIHTALHDRVSEIRKTFNKLHVNLERNPTVSEFKYELDQKFKPPKVSANQTLFKFIENYIENSKNRVNPDRGTKIAHTTLKKYITTQNHLKEFAESKKLNLDFPNLDLQFYERFNAFLTNDKKLALNSIGKYIQTVKTFLKAAEEEGIEVNPIYRSRRFKSPSELTDKIYLNEEELRELFELELTDRPALDRVRDLFLVGAWTGLRFSDFNKLRPDQFNEDTLKIYTEKTHDSITIPLHNCVKAIRAKYHSVNANSYPDSISNQKMNDRLKELAQLVEGLRHPVTLGKTKGGIRLLETKMKAEFVSTHTARRSFATNMYKRGCPVRSIMAITGHKSESSFRAYLRLNSEEHADIMREFMK